MGENLFWLPWHTGKFAGSTRGWPIIARGIYRELLDAQWDQDGLPIGEPELQRIAAVTDSEWRQGWPWCLPKFPIVNGKRRNPTLEFYRADALKNRSTASTKGKKGAAARWGKNSRSNAPATETMAEPSIQPMPEQWPTSTSSSISSSEPKTPESGAPKMAHKGNGARRITHTPPPSALPTPPGYPESVDEIAKRSIAEMRKNLGLKNDD